MPNAQLLHHLVYLDRDFVTGAYEAILGEAPVTQVTKNESMKAGAQIPFFSAGVSATESKTFSVSTFGMLAKLLPELNQLPTISKVPLAEGAASTTCWIEGALCVYKVVVRESSKVHEQRSPAGGFGQTYNPEKASETYFAIHAPSGVKLALITTPDYFSSGLDALTKLSATVLEKASIPVRALVRVYAATSSFKEWIAVPLVVIERT